jgi:nicotinamidase-related amidase
MAGEALLIIDMQAGILAEVPDADALTVRVAELANRTRGAGRPVFVIQHQSADLVPGKPEWRLAELITAGDGDVLLAKRNADSFIGTDLDERLREMGISHVIVTGLTTEFCIDSTCRAALSRGYDLTLIEDGHSTTVLPTDSVLSAEAIVARYNQVLSSVEYPDREVRVISADDITFT